jgi:triacylglycerol lipase
MQNSKGEFKMQVLKILILTSVIAFASKTAISQGFRPLSNLVPVAELLNSDWDTNGEIKWDILSAVALLSNRVYDDDLESLDYSFKSMGFDEWIEVRNGNTVAHVLLSKDTLVVVIRGSDDLDDWLHNIQFLPTKPRGEVGFSFHPGFLKAYCSIRDQLATIVSEKIEARRFWLCGHSLGAAIATLCAIDIEHGKKIQAKPTLVTFGQPRVTNRAGAEWIDSKFSGRYIRIVNDNDIATRVPPEFLQYSHAGKAIRLYEHSYESGFSSNFKTASGNDVYQASIEPPSISRAEYCQLLCELRANPRFSESDGWGDELKEASILSSRKRPFYDHKMKNYIERIRFQRDLPPPHTSE